MGWRHAARRGRWRDGALATALPVMLAAACTAASGTPASHASLLGWPSMAPRPTPSAALTPVAARASPSTPFQTVLSSARTSTPTPRPLIDISGSGFRTTPPFEAPASWTIGYRFDCSAYGAEGNFQVVVYTEGQLVGVAVNAVAFSGSGRAVEHGTAGKTYLQINSECAWQVTVQR